MVVVPLYRCPVKIAIRSAGSPPEDGSLYVHSRMDARAFQDVGKERHSTNCKQGPYQLKFPVRHRQRRHRSARLHSLTAEAMQGHRREHFHY